MLEFFRALAVEENAFLRTALAGGLLASVAAGVMGSFVVSRRITYLAGGIAHSVLGGLGAAVYLRWALGWEWVDPIYGAVAAALLSALVIGIVSLRAREREDTLISAIWAVGMAAGVLFIYATPGYAVDPMSYLFGNILMISAREVWLVAALDIVILVVVGAYYRRLVAVAFDEEFARLRGVRVPVFYLVLLCLTALTVVALVAVVGIVLAIALLSLPAAAAGRFSRTIFGMMLLAVALSAVATVGGLAASWGPDLPAGAMIVLVAGGLYLVAALAAVMRRRRAQRRAAGKDV